MNQPTVERAHWERVAPCWVAGAERIRRMTHAVTGALVAALEPLAGARVLDLACGAGDPALALLERVGPAGRVTACDPVAAMTHALHASARDPRLAVVRCAAERPSFAPASFDALSCRFGVMFLADPGPTLQRWHALLRVGGRLAVAVWAEPAANPYFSVVGEVLDAAGAPPAELAHPGRGIFEYEDGERLAALLAEAGFRQVTSAPLAFSMELPDTPPEGLLDAQRELSPLIAQRCAGLPDAAFPDLRRAVASAAQGWRAESGLAIPARAWIHTARRD